MSPTAQASWNAEDPVGEWISTWSSFEIVTNELGACCMFGYPRFACGVYRDPVASIEVEVRDRPGAPWSPSIRRSVSSRTDTGGFTVFVVECGCSKVQVHTLAADSREPGTVPN